MTTNCLPCHVGVGRRPGPPRSAKYVTGISSHQNNPDRRQPGEIPYVSPDGGKTRYYSDRCYLDAPTDLLEYQLANDGEDSSKLNVPRNDDVDYCNFCGEIRANTTQYHRGTIAPDKVPVPNWPLFDRAKLINSLDLSAAIIGTYTIGDFECLSNEFKLLFPRPNDKSTSNRRHVPTLVLHGQRGFSLDKWSSAKAQQRHTHEMKDVRSDDTDNVAMNIRGGGYECQDVFNRAGVAEKVTIESRKMGAEKRSSLTFEGFQLKLPKTPKRLKKSKPKVTHNNIKNACEGSDPDKRVKSGGGPIAEVIVIDSDSEDDLMPIDNTTTMSTKVEQLTPSMSTEAQSLVNDLSQNCNQDCNHVEEKLSQVEHVKSNTSDNSPKIGWGAIKPVSVFAGEVFFTQVLPRWCPPSSKHKKKRTSSKEPAGTRETTQARKRAEKKVSAEYSDDEDGQNTRAELLQEEYKQHTTQPKNEDDPEMKTVRGVHHPKFFLLFERSGSLVSGCQPAAMPASVK